MKKILIVCFNNIEFDARSHNMLTTYSSLNHSCSALHISNGQLLMPNIATYNHKDVFLSKPLKYLSFYKFVNKHLRLIQPDICIASDLISLIMICLSFKRIQTIYDSREIYSHLAGLRHSPAKQKLLTFLESICIKLCSKVLVTAESDKQYLSAHYKKNNISIIKNFPLLSMAPKKTNILRLSHAIPESSSILLYQGALQHGRGLFKYIQVLSKLNKCYLVIIGDGPIKNQLIDCAISNKVKKRIIFLSWVPYNKLLELTASADVGLSMIQPLSLSYYNALPNKLFEYALSGIPTIGSNIPEIKKILKDKRLGLAIDNQKASLLRAIKATLENKNFYDFDTIQSIAKKKFVWETQQQALTDCLNEK